MNKERIKSVLRILIFLAKTGQLKNCLTLLIWVVKEKLSYDDAMQRLYHPEDYWKKKVENAAEDYLSTQPKATIHVPGYERWEELMRE